MLRDGVGNTVYDESAFLDCYPLDSGMPGVYGDKPESLLPVRSAAL
jgi:hypothetical protein